MQCSICGGDGCDDCSDGFIRFTSCPQRTIPRRIIHLVEDTALFKKGLPPDPGGTHDQDAWFVNASRELLADISSIQPSIGD